MISKILIWGLAGGTLGAVVGYLGRCAGGACPLTCNPIGGIISGTLIGVILATNAVNDHKTDYAKGVESAGGKELEKALDSRKAVVLYFHASWCGPCRKVQPIIDEIETEYTNSVIVVKVDVDRQKELAAGYGVNSVPDIRIYGGGSLVKQFSGIKRKGDYVKAIRKAYEKASTNS